jgi:diguanylate cyclase (GGDEF)-like protein
VARLRGVLRTDDVIGRYGGEEFALILPGFPDESDALTERLRASVADSPIATRVGPIPATISLGRVAMGPDDHDVTQLLTRADAALYQAKQSGRNRVCIG